MRALVFLCISQHTKFEVPSFTNSKDMIGGKIIKWPLTGTDGRLFATDVCANFKVT